MQGVFVDPDYVLKCFMQRLTDIGSNQNNVRHYHLLQWGLAFP